MKRAGFDYCVSISVPWVLDPSPHCPPNQGNLTLSLNSLIEEREKSNQEETPDARNDVLTRFCLIWRVIDFTTSEIMPRKNSKTSKRTKISPAKRGNRYVRRNKQGELKKEVKFGRSLAADRRTKGKKKVPKGQGGRGDTV